ncbi:hypothetical protein GCM10027343_15960 [Noviherbaspirillum agri]
MKLALLALASTEALFAEDFLPLKPHLFGRIRSGILQVVSFQGQKSDAYVWSNALPLSLPGLNPRGGWKNATGRYPEETGELTCANPSDVPRISAELAALCRDAVLPRLNDLASPERLVHALNEVITIYAAFPKAFCFFQMGDLDEGRRCLERFLLDPIDRLDKREARRLLDLSDDALTETVESQIRENIKLHKLSRLMTRT